MSADLIAAAIRAVAPNADAAGWAAVMAPVLPAAGIVSTHRLAMFIGQCAVESACFSRTEEDLTYTHASRLRDVWPAHFPVDVDPTPYLNHPEALANYVYAGRMGNYAQGDGWLFRGRGLIQITGRTTYTDFANALGQDAEEIADWVATREGAARSAAWFWSWVGHGGCNRAADAWIVTDATRLINPGLQAVNDRIEVCNRALSALAAIAPTVPARKVWPEPQTTGDASADALNAAELGRITS